MLHLLYFISLLCNLQTFYRITFNISWFQKYSNAFDQFERPEGAVGSKCRMKRLPSFHPTIILLHWAQKWLSAKVKYHRNTEFSLNLMQATSTCKWD